MKRVIDIDKYNILDAVIAIVEEWQDKGRTGFCLPVIRGEVLERLEELADERRRDSCSWCRGTGKLSDGYEDFNCAHCEPLGAPE